MSIYISPLQRSGIHRFYIVVADRHSELQTAANFYASRIIKVNQKNSYIVVPERKRLFGLALEGNVVTPLNPRTNPFDFSNDRGGGLAGDRPAGDNERKIKFDPNQHIDRETAPLIYDPNANLDRETASRTKLANGIREIHIGRKRVAI